MLNHQNQINEPLLLKIRKEEQALAGEMKRYKMLYHGKNQQIIEVDKYISMVKYLNVLLNSHCQNMVAINANNIQGQVKEMSGLLEDVLVRFEEVNNKYVSKMGLSVQDVRANQLSQLCTLCGQNVRKTQVERLKNHLLHQNSLYVNKYGEEESSKSQDQDLLFFAQVNNLLTNKQADIMRNQKKIGKFQQLAIDSLETLLTVHKDFMNKESTPIPSNAWMREAKKEMEFILKDSFQGKIPPWVMRMFNLFTNLQYRSKFEKLREVQVQTEVSSINEMMELKKKNIISTRKLEDVELISKNQEKEIVNLTTECELLDTKVVYYKTEINRLISEIDNLKRENQEVQKKLLNINNLNRSRVSRRINNISNEKSESQINDNYSNVDIRTNKTIHKNSISHNSSDKKLLPRIYVNKDQKHKRNTEESRTSIKVNNNSSQNKKRDNTLSKLRLKHQSSNISQHSNSQEEIWNSHERSQYSSSSQHRNNNNRQPKRSNNKQHKISYQSNQIRGMSMKNIIPEVQGESNLEEQRNRVKKVNQQLKQIIKHGMNIKKQNGALRSSLPLPTLKKVSRKGVAQNINEQLDKLITSKLQEQTETQTPQVTQINDKIQQEQTTKIASIYNELKNNGNLIKISEEQFKMVIKIKAFNFGSQPTSPTETPDLSNYTRYTDRTKKTARITPSKKQMTQVLSQYSDQYKTVRSSFYSPSSVIKYSKNKDYSALFASQANAFQYESSFSKAPQKSSYALNKAEERLSKELFEHLASLKKQDEQQYRYVCSYLRYPFQIMQDNIGIVSISDLKQSLFETCFKRIAALHVKCRKQDGLCSHLVNFRQKLIKNKRFNQTI